MLANFDAGAITRGRHYFETNKVVSWEWLEEDSILRGKVRGSGQRLYVQNVDLIIFAEEGEIFGDCSCPVGYNCKHVVALILQSQGHDISAPGANAPQKSARAAQNTPDALTQWQTLLDSHCAHSVNDFAAKTEHIVYRLVRGYRDQWQLRVDRSRRLVKGGWGAVGSVSIDSLAAGYGRPSYAKEIDGVIARLMQQMMRVEYGQFDYDTLIPKGALGASLMEKLLESGRLYVEGLSEYPVTRAVDSTASFHWDQHNGNYRLCIDILPEGSDTPLDENEVMLFKTSPPAYLQAQKNQAGFVHTTLDAPIFNAIDSLPPLTEKEAQAFSRQLFSEYREVSLPPPVEIGIQRYEGDSTPVLMLSTTQKNGKTLNYCRLNIRYGSCLLEPEISAADDMRLYQDDEDNDWLIDRDVDVERSYTRKLLDMGMVQVPAAVLGGGQGLGKGKSQGASESDHVLDRDWFFMPTSDHHHIKQWQVFLREGISELEALDWQIQHDPSFSLKFASSDLSRGQINGRGDWFTVALDLKIGRQKVALLPLVLQWITENTLRSPDDMLLEHKPNEWITISKSVAQPIVDTLVELHSGHTLDEHGRLQLPRVQAPSAFYLEEALKVQNPEFSFTGGKRLRDLATQLTHFDGIHVQPIPAALNAELRPYQHDGVNWLGFIAQFGFGGILADDMGLGKTLQTLTHLLIEKTAGRLKTPALVVAPTSLLSNWKREAERFAPDLRVAISHGIDRVGGSINAKHCDLIVTSYSLLVRDEAALGGIHWHAVVLDEAQMIKNPVSQTAQVARGLKAQYRLCLTGTPIENHLGELWSLFHFLMPAFLGSQPSFNSMFRKPIENDASTKRQQELNRRVRPFMLRRTKIEVAAELPPKTEIIKSVTLGEAQARLYETVRVAMEDKIAKLMKAKGLASSRIEMLDALLKLRQSCCDPQLLKIPSAQKVKQSAKRELLMTLLPELVEEGRRILVFSQFTSMLSLIEQDLNQRDIGYTKLTGQTRKRDDAIARFQQGDVPVFLISLKAGGVGLNLTEADTVIHYDPWWNPAAENQATDRAHRIGQDKPVFVYKLITENTVEEKILALQQKKQAMADALYADGENVGFSADELLGLFDA
ncbi:Uncharacterised protein [BD1-7 clade bacterium]|nr:Uncharacterised protein [BD1-7 clade bacterium]